MLMENRGRVFILKGLCLTRDENGEFWDVKIMLAPGNGVIRVPDFGEWEQQLSSDVTSSPGSKPDSELSSES
jgi:hypothetical protein